jgi:hypothetical protein
MAVIAAAAADVLLALKRCHAIRQTALGIAILTEIRTNERMILFKSHVWFLTGLSLWFGRGSRPERLLQWVAANTYATRTRQRVLVVDRSSTEWSD